MEKITKSKLGISRMIIVVVVVVIVVIGAAGGLYLTSLNSSSTTKSTTTSSTTSSTGSATGVTSTGSSSTCKPTASNPPSAITIGASFPISGGFSSFGPLLLTGAQAGVQYINQVRGGIYVSAYCQSIPVKLVYYDDQSTPSVGVGIYNNLIAQNVSVLMGTYGTPIIYAYEQEVIASGYPFLDTGNALGDTIWNQNATNMFMIAATSSQGGVNSMKYLIQFLNAEYHGAKITNASFIADNNENTIDQIKAYEQVCLANGIKIVYNQTIPDSLSSYATVTQGLKAANAGFTWINVEDTPTEVEIFKELAVNGFHTNVITGYSLSAPGTLTSMGNLALGAIGTGTWVPSIAPVNQSDVAKQLSFYLNYSKAQGLSTIKYETAVNGFSTVVIYADAIQAAGSLSHTAIINALKGTYYTIYGPYHPGEPEHVQATSPTSVLEIMNVNGTLQAVTVYPPGPGVPAPDFGLSQFTK